MKNNAQCLNGITSTTFMTTYHFVQVVIKIISYLHHVYALFVVMNGFMSVYWTKKKNFSREWILRLNDSEWPVPTINQHCV